MENLRTYKLQYNKALERYRKAEAWLDDPKRTDNEVERWGVEFQKVVSTLELLLWKIGEHTPDESVNGFKV